MKNEKVVIEGLLVEVYEGCPRDMNDKNVLKLNSFAVKRVINKYKLSET